MAMHISQVLRPQAPSSGKSKIRKRPPRRRVRAPLSEDQKDAHADANARYRDRHRAEVLAARRECAARRRAAQANDKEAHVRALEAAARYRAGHREELAAKQQKVRKRAFIAKHGVHKYIQRRFDAPPPARTPSPPVMFPELDDDDSWATSGIY
ncbi:hypothetical protein FB45DRAFT_1030819 [Roridomyces roridus]|uniref:Uncharacterized protein n=1 Tax=Roridomyces roridus TaxID=1738132 RepID=A0AAD7FK35_9AGAR|nr:hypothetical protein FB45DRAFT_1030819 [Roridomyces roridus]